MLETNTSVRVKKHVRELLLTDLAFVDKEVPRAV
jgi:hypothetical protein